MGFKIELAKPIPVFNVLCEKMTQQQTVSETGVWIATWVARTIKDQNSTKAKLRPAGKPFGRRDPGPGWKVAWKDVTGIQHIVPLTFARPKDAEMAAIAASNAYDWGPTLSEVIDQMSEFGHAEFRKILVEAMAW